MSAGLAGEATAGLSLEGSGGGGGGGGGPGEGTLFVDSIAHGGVTLPSIVTGSLQAATLAYVGEILSVGDWFYLVRGQGLTADNINVVNSGTEAGAQWVRMNIPNQVWLAHTTVAAFWAVDPVGGNDENRGCGATLAAARLVPLKTQAELNRRFSGAVNIAPQIELQGNIPNSDDIGFPNLRTQTRDLIPIVTGRIDPVGGTVNPPVFSGAITGYVTAVPATNTPFQMTIAGLPVSWTASGLIGFMIQKNDGSKTAWALADLGAKTARISEPRTSSTISPGVPTNFVVGETVNVYRLFTVPTWPFGQWGIFQRAGNLEIQGKRVSGAGNQQNIGGSSPTLSNCRINGIIWQGGNQGTLGNVLAVGAVNSLSGFRLMGISGLAVSGGILQLTDTTTQALDGTVQIDGAASRINLASLALLNIKAPCAIAIFDDATFGVDCAVEGSLWMVGSGIYGAGNTSTLVNIDAGSRCRILAASTAVTTGDQVNLAGAPLAFAAIPQIDVPNQCGVSG